MATPIGRGHWFFDLLLNTRLWNDSKFKSGINTFIVYLFWKRFPACLLAPNAKNNIKIEKFFIASLHNDPSRHEFASRLF